MPALAVVGVDGGPGGRAAIALARALGAEAPLLVHIRVIEPGNISAAFDPAGEHDSARLLARERELGCPEAATLSMVAPDVAGGLHRVAESRGAGLLVLGGSGECALACLNHAPCAAVIAPGPPPREPATRIGVGVDGSPQSRVALAYAERLAATLGAELALHTAEADPAGELADFSREVDLLVCGSRPEGLLRRVMLGEASRHLARHSACPLLVVPAGVAVPVRLSA